MALCSSCSAPLPADSYRCSYCGTRNDMDFAAVDRFTISREPSRRRCPDCGIALETIRIGSGGAFAIERCERCFGLFFDVGELPAFLDASVSPAFSINLKEIASINEERAAAPRPVRYIKCPECGVLMNRINYAAMSGVVVDQCKAHGMWLDNGELVHLMEWKKVGGELLAEQKEKMRQEELAREGRRSVPPYSMSGYPEPSDLTTDIFSAACTVLINTLFR